MDEKLGRAVLLYEFRPREALSHVNVAFGLGSVPKSTARCWFKKFAKICYSLEDWKWTGRPSNFNSQVSKGLMESDPSQAQEEMAMKLHVSKQTISAHLKPLGSNWSSSCLGNMSEIKSIWKTTSSSVLNLKNPHFELPLRKHCHAGNADGQATEKQKKADIEKVITERMKNWGRVHNLPEWAQERIAKSVVQEDERRKRRAELEAKKFQILKKATLRHAIVIGDKAAAEEKVKAQLQ
ncbi:hypothetical protein TTRE_0000483901 [Trichuris trichiura]|uniref:Mos1 transposase HTH domain-containing protein n=1 Tax=Trichuris trichiura TaxID=36087 RepID=A0A077Z9V6_TRITR|nr:hypothetical protein TTRE_0000483901 [Trichuris trichiura]